MINDILSNIEGKMQTSVKVLERELAGIRTGRATPALVDHIMVDYSGTSTRLNQIAGISVPEARLLVIQPWDKSSFQNIEKAIQKSDLGINPTNDGNVIRLNIPPLTEERRQELVKLVRKKVEDGKIAIRNLRHEAMGDIKKLEKDKEISQDESKRTLDQLQKITNSFTAITEKKGQDKEIELMNI
ncbi:MAG: ribosome recycling factor [Dehalococcoidales bacterium]|nr:ribosome recycling factor [Dehalococcoidales bacterium]